MSDATSALSTVIVGSFGMHMHEIARAAHVFEDCGIKVLSPPGLAQGSAGFIDGGSSDFLVLEADDAVDPKTLQDRVIEKMKRASFIYWVNPGGYVGTSATWELGNANSIRRDNGAAVPIYAWHRPDNATLALYLEGMIFEPEALCRLLADATGKRALESATHLFFDIDDTLIEDQCHLQAAEHAVDSFLAGFARLFVDIERRNIPAIGHGYGFGTASYIASFVETYMKMDPILRHEANFKRIVSELLKTRRGPPEAFPGVPETLSALQARNYILHVLSKGERREQVSKLVQLDIHKYFSTIHMVGHKSPQTYRRIADELRLDPATCWMIGNSIADDINPSVAADWGAVHVHAPFEWQLEQGALTAVSSRLKRVNVITELLEIFKDNSKYTNPSA